MFNRTLLDYLIFPFPEHVYYDNWLGYIAATLRTGPIILINPWYCIVFTEVI